MDAAAILGFFTPYEPSPTVWGLSAVALGGFLLGLRRLAGRGGRQRPLAAAAFLLGLGLLYLTLQSRLDYYAQHLFFLHRLQHLVLHHLAPFLIALSAPQQVFAAAFEGLAIPRHWPGQRLSGRVYRGIQQPAVAGALFVGLIWIWLIPSIHPAAMLSLPLYNLMNWGMALDGLLFWWMIFNMRDADESPARHLGGRLLVLGLIILPQILVGSGIALSHQDLYPIYELCGRLLPMSAATDQQLGGLITWIPAAMMSVIGALILTHRWLSGSAETHPGLVLAPSSRRGEP